MTRQKKSGARKPLWRRVLSAIRTSRPVQWLWSDTYLVILRIGREAGADISTPTPMNVNCRDDLEKFEQTEPWLTRDAFLAEADRRMAAGEKIFTATVDDVLAHYGWLVPDQREAYFPAADQHYTFPEGTTVMYNGYAHPLARGRGLHHVSLRSRVQWAFARPETNYVYAAIDIDNGVSRHCSEKLGLQHHEVLYRKCRFGRVTKGHLPPSFVKDYDARRQLSLKG